MCRRIRCGWAQHKQDIPENVDFAAIDQADPSNANIYVGNVSPEVDEAELRSHFAAYGKVEEVKIYRKGECLKFSEIELGTDTPWDTPWWPSLSQCEYMLIVLLGVIFRPLVHCILHIVSSSTATAELTHCDSAVHDMTMPELQ